MVLKSISSILLLALLQTISFEGPLYVKYKSEIEKRLAKTLDIDKDLIAYDALPSNSTKLEAYALSTENNKIAFLYIKEVQACSLNGCVAKKVSNNNIAAEYYDIAVVTDLSKTIKSIYILDYFSDYGYEISSKRYLKKYNGFKLCDFSQETNQVDGISGATISYNALIESLDEFCSITIN